METTATEREPWRRSWFYCAPGEVLTLVWIVLLHGISVVGLLTLPMPSIGAVVTAFALAFLGGLGTTVAYHRALAHRAVSLHPVVEQILILFAVVNGSGNPKNWVAMHRLHHATSDRHDDISSPYQGGFWWAHLRWVWQADTARAATMAPDLDKVRYRFWGRVQVPLLAASLLCGLLWLWPAQTTAEWLAAALWIGPIRLLYALHVQCTVNSICHLGTVTESAGSSRNVWWLALAHLGHGENWHRNHHARPGDARLGQRWWQIDLGWLTIRLLNSCRLAQCRRATGNPQDSASSPGIMPTTA